MTKGELDWEMVLIIPFSLGAAASLGLIQGNILPVIDLGETIFQEGDIEFTAGRIISILALLTVGINRDAPLTSTGGIDLWIVYATAALVLTPAFVPALESTLAEQPAAIVSFSVQSLGFTFVSKTN
jgi:ABC-type uncharacterized transport system permease subunit